MHYKKINTLRFFLTQEECGRDDVEVTVEYRADKSNPNRGNCFVDYWVNIKDYGFRSHMGGVLLSVNKDTIIAKIKAHMMPFVEEQIKLYERYVELIENYEESLEM